MFCSKPSPFPTHHCRREIFLFETLNMERLSLPCGVCYIYHVSTYSATISLRPYCARVGLPPAVIQWHSFGRSSCARTIQRIFSARINGCRVSEIRGFQDNVRFWIREAYEISMTNQAILNWGITAPIIPLVPCKLVIPLHFSIAPRSSPSPAQQQQQQQQEDRSRRALPQLDLLEQETLWRHRLKKQKQTQRQHGQ